MIAELGVSQNPAGVSDADRRCLPRGAAPGDDPAARQARMDQRDRPGHTEPMLAAGPIENAGPREPAGATGKIEPAEPAGKIEPDEPIDRIEPLEATRSGCR